jgi:WD40 repeat protein
MPEFSHNRAVVIGINNYGNGISSLHNAVNDAKKLIEILRQQHGYQVWVSLDEVATLKNLNKLLEETLPEQVKSDDRLIFYFAGHGIALNGDEGPEGYLIPQDAKLGDIQSYLPMTKLQDSLSELPCRHFLGILDCCFAGAFRWSSTRDFSTTPEVIHKERYDRFIEDPAWQVITSAAYDQKALDAFSLDTQRGQVGQHSPFAAALIEALAGEADLYPPAINGKQSGDGVITATELYLYLRDRIEPATEGYRHRQTPGIWPLKKHDKGEYIFLNPGHELNLPPAPPLDESQNPYRGLESFDEQHSRLFFGRTALTEKLCDFVCEHPLTVVVGASGSGKSSLVKAGLVSHLRQPEPNQTKQGRRIDLEPSQQKHHHKQQQWRILAPMRPGESPFRALNITLAQEEIPVVPISNQTYEQALESFSARMADWCQLNPNSKLLLVVDQLEELITLCRDDQERKNFLHFLTKAVNNYPEHLRLVLTLRSDFEPQFQDTHLKDYWARFPVPAMTRAELRQAIEEPASAKVMFFKSDDPQNPLIDQLIDEVAEMPGALPLLSFTLSELYLKYLKRQRSAQYRGETIERAITEADYRELGGVARSLTQRADAEYEELVNQDKAYEQTIRHVMLRMVAVGGGELARRRVPLSELEYPASENERRQEVIRRFSAARLLVEGQDTEGNPYVEPAHDALVRGWAKLLTWQQEKQESLILQRRVTPAAFEWKSKEQPPGFLGKATPLVNSVVQNLYSDENLLNKIKAKFIRLWRRQPDKQGRSREKQVQFLWNANPYLEVLNKELKSNDNWFNWVEAEFVQQSVLQKHKNSALGWSIATAVFLGLSGLTILALWNLRQAVIGQMLTYSQSAETDLQSNQLVLDALKSSLGAGKSLKQDLLLKLRQPEEWKKEQVIRTLRKAVYTVKEYNRLQGFTSGIETVFWSQDGKLFVASTEQNGTISVLDKQGNQLAELPGNPDAVSKVIFSPDGTKVAIGGENGIIRLWNWQNPQRLIQWKAHQEAIISISFSPDGSQLASAARDGTSRLWNLSGNQVPKFQQPVRNLSGNQVQTFQQPVRNLSGNQVQTFQQPQNVISVGFSPNGQLLKVTTTEDGRTVCLLNSSGKVLCNREKLPVSVDEAILSPDGEQVVIIYGTARNGLRGESLLWNWRQNNSQLLDKDIFVSFSRDGKQLATTGLDDGTVRLRDSDGIQVAELKGHHGEIRSINFKSDGKEIATASTDGTVRLWTLQPQSLRLFKQLQGSLRSVTFSSDGNKLAAQGTDGTIRLWDLFSQRSRKLAGQYGLFNSLSFSPNGKQLAVLGEDGTVRLWDLFSQRSRKLAGQYDSSSNLSFSPNGKQLAVLGEDRTVRLLDLPSGTQVEKLQGSQEGADMKPNAIWRPDGKILLATLASPPSRSIRLLDVRSNKLYASIPVQGDSRSFSSISSNDDGSLIAIGQENGTVSLWYQEGSKLGEFKAYDGNIKSVILSPDSSMLATIGEDGTTKLWQIGKLDELLSRGCNRLRDYLNNPRISESDRALCKN